MKLQTIQIDIDGMTCEHCARTIEKVLDAPGIIEKAVRFNDRRAHVSFDPDQIDQAKITRRINEIGQYHVSHIKEIVKQNGRQKHVIIIGGGSAAFAATLHAHELGARVTMINAGLPIGGTCVNVGCVPSKNLIRAAEELHRSQERRFSGITKEGHLSSFTDIIHQKGEMVSDLRQEKYTDVIADMEDLEKSEPVNAKKSAPPKPLPVKKPMKEFSGHGEAVSDKANDSQRQVQNKQMVESAPASQMLG